MLLLRTADNDGLMGLRPKPTPDFGERTRKRERAGPTVRRLYRHRLMAIRHSSASAGLFRLGIAGQTLKSRRRPSAANASGQEKAAHAIAKGGQVVVPTLGGKDDPNRISGYRDQIKRRR
jgi:hypothetical protein